jgi:hypothetical protein
MTLDNLSDLLRSVRLRGALYFHVGDVIVISHGDAHVLSSAPGMRAAPDIDFLYRSRPPQLPFMLHQGMERRDRAQASRWRGRAGARGQNDVRRSSSPLPGALAADQRAGQNAALSDS